MLIFYACFFLTQIDTAPCDDGDIRLQTEGTMGPLQVCVSKRWASVCYHRWFDVAPSVICRQLGYAGRDISNLCRHEPVVMVIKRGKISGFLQVFDPNVVTRFQNGRNKTAKPGGKAR